MNVIVVSFHAWQARQDARTQPLYPLSAWKAKDIVKTAAAAIKNA
jgi:hypothetical protein